MRKTPKRRTGKKEPHWKADSSRLLRHRERFTGPDSPEYQRLLKEHRRTTKAELVWLLANSERNERRLKSCLVEAKPLPFSRQEGLEMVAEARAREQRADSVKGLTAHAIGKYASALDRANSRIEKIHAATIAPEVPE